MRNLRFREIKFGVVYLTKMEAKPDEKFRLIRFKVINEDGIEYGLRYFDVQEVDSIIVVTSPHQVNINAGSIYEQLRSWYNDIQVWRRKSDN